MKSQAGQVLKVKVTEVTEESYFFKDIKNNTYEIPKHRCKKSYIVNQFINIYSFINKAGQVSYSTDLPFLKLGEVGVLEVVAINKNGFFLNNNTQRDLLLPNSEKVGFIKEGDQILVKVLAKTDGLERATMKIQNHERMIDSDRVENGKRYRGIVIKKIKSKTSKKTDTVIARMATGLNVFIHNSEYDKEPRLNEEIEFRVIFIREDKKVNASLLPHVKDRLKIDQKKILEFLYQENGVTTITEKSDSELIMQKMGLSKKSYKKAIRALLEQKKVEFKNQKFYLLKQ